MWKRIRRQLTWRAVAVTLLVSLLLAAAGIAGYRAGSPPSVDISAIRSAATEEGREAGAKEGAEAGYAQGYKAARNRSYGPTYSTAYKEAYTREFELAGLEPPQQIPVPEPR